MNKAKSGQDITIAFLGGLITQGCNATKFEDCYASRTYKWFKDKFNNVNVKYINAGVGATGSIIGAHRVEKQVLSQNPDIVFIDFAVNDKDSIYDKVAYESIIRRILSVENPPAIVEVFMRLVVTGRKKFSAVPKRLQNDVKETAKDYIGKNVAGVLLTEELYNELFGWFAINMK